MKTTIAQVPAYEGQEVTIGVWLTNKRSSGKNCISAAAGWDWIYSGSCCQK